MTGDDAAKWRYLDASAMVKLVANDVDEEPGRVALREYYFAHGMYRATAYCVAEALSAFKTKWLRGRITQSDYITDVREFFRLVVSSLHIEEVPLAGQVHSEAERLVEAYGIDFIDSIQVVTLMAGKYSVLVGPSQSIFITADRALAVALVERVRGCGSALLRVRLRDASRVACAGEHVLAGISPRSEVVDLEEIVKPTALCDALSFQI